MTVKPHDWKHVLWLALQLDLEPEFHRPVKLNKLRMRILLWSKAAVEDFAAKANAVRTVCDLRDFQSEKQACGCVVGQSLLGQLYQLRSLYDLDQ